MHNLMNHIWSSYVIEKESLIFQLPKTTKRFQRQFPLR